MGRPKTRTEPTKHVSLRMPLALHGALWDCARQLTGGQLSVLIIDALWGVLPELQVRSLRASQQRLEVELVAADDPRNLTDEDRRLRELVFRCIEPLRLQLVAMERQLGAAPAPDNPPLPRGPLRVLAVDPDAGQQEFMRDEAERLGHEVTVCSDGQVALDVLGDCFFDVAVLELRLPDMSGLEVLAHLKMVSPDTEAVILTPHASMESAIEALRLGALDYITKPCKPAEIEGVLRRVAERRVLKNRSEGHIRGAA
jgi:CheY-like chemotaxis protein